MNRRELLKGAAYLGSWIALGARVPKFLGDPAGGFYAPVPQDLAAYLQWSPALHPVSQLGTVRLARLCACWAPLGSDVGAIAEFAGTIISAESDTPGKIIASQANLVESFRALLPTYHEPGWFKVRRTVATNDVDEDGDPIMTSEEVWKRIGYLKWLTPADMRAFSAGLIRGVAA